MTVEQLLTEALHTADGYQPSIDLFDKVQRSIQEDSVHRRRVRRIVAWSVSGLLATVVWVIAFLGMRDGSLVMPWWTVEVLTVALLVTIVLVFGPFIRRFGLLLTDEVFAVNRETSWRFLAVLDIAYYLIFTAYVLMTTSFAPQTGWEGQLAAQIESEVSRVAGLLLLMGVLHAVTIAVLPVVGLVFTSNWRRAVRAELGDDAPEPAPRAERADRIARIIVWAVAAVLALQAIGLLSGPGFLGLILGAD